jgi:hypothetical protein
MIERKSRRKNLFNAREKKTIKLDITNVCQWMVYTNRIDRSIYTINICYEEPQSIDKDLNNIHIHKDFKQYSHRQIMSFLPFVPLATKVVEAIMDGILPGSARRGKSRREYF